MQKNINKYQYNAEYNQQVAEEYRQHKPIYMWNMTNLGFNKSGIKPSCCGDECF